jgi:hypothetical protein
MQQAAPGKRFRERLTYANVMSTVAVFLALGGATALAAGQLGKNSVGSRQIKSQAVTTGKVANNAITGAKVAPHTLGGTDLDLNMLGTVPNAATAAQAGNSQTVGGHAAACPPGTTLFHRICYDAASSSPASSLFEAAESCSSKGGYLPTPMQLYEARTVLSLGTGTGADHQYTDEYYGNTNGGSYRTVVIDGTGALTESDVNSPSRYICAYPLVG